MDDKEFSGIPIKTPDRKVGQSMKTDVYGYDDPSLVVKLRKPETTQTGKKTDEAISQANQRSEIIRKIAELSQRNGARVQAVPVQNPILYDAPNNSGAIVGYAQKHYPDAVTLSELKGNLTKLPPASLRDLKAIFEANLDIWKEEKRLIDIVGSNGPHFNRAAKLLESLNPLAHANNIIVDSKQNPHLIDTELLYGKNFKSGLNSWISQRIQILGTKRAIRQIDAQLKRSSHSEVPQTQPQPI